MKTFRPPSFPPLKVGLGPPILKFLGGHMTFAKRFKAGLILGLFQLFHGNELNPDRVPGQVSDWNVPGRCYKQITIIMTVYILDI